MYCGSRITYKHDTLGGSLRIDNSLAAILSGDDMRYLVRILIKNSWGDVGFEESSTNCEHVQSNSEWPNSIAGLNDLWRGRDYQKH